MSNDPKTDLIYAVLAMDSYNRGYGAGINGLTENDPVGTRSISTTSTDEFQQDAFNAGFDAIAYRNTATNELVISYRGTDFNGKRSSLGVVSRSSHTQRRHPELVSGSICIT
jgi:hypothetical protein